MIYTSTHDLSSRFAPVFAEANGPVTLTGATGCALTLAAEGKLTVQWSPFDHVATRARLVLVGITPGAVQAGNAVRAFQQARRSGAALDEASRRAKAAGSFSGPLRDRLVAMMNHVGAPAALGANCFAELFAVDRGEVHFTSALRYPVFVEGRNYNGTPHMLRTPLLRRMIETYLAAEVRALSGALWLPLGPKPAEALHHLASLGILESGRILPRLPHPGSANAERVAYFLGRKPRGRLSAKTRAEPLDASREALRAAFARFQHEGR